MPPEQIQPQAPLPPQKPPFNFWETDPKRNFAPWFLKFCIVLVIIGLAITGYFKYRAYQNYKSGLSVVEQSQNSIGDSLTAWQTYRNEKYGFEFKYPQNYKITSEASNKDGVRIVLEITGSYFSIIFDALLADTYTATNSTAVKSTNIPSDLSNSPFKYMFVARDDSAQVDWIFYKVESGGVIYIAIVQNRNVLEDISTHQQEAKQILSTFKIIK